MFKWYRISLLVIFFLNACVSDEDLKKGFADATRLKWEQFKGSAPNDSNNNAVAYSSTRISFHCNDGELVDTYKACKVSFYFDEYASWVSKGRDFDSSRILEHESGHYRLTAIYAKKLGNIILKNKWETYARKEDIDAVASKLQRELSDVQLQYDEETSHSNNIVLQRKWDSLIIEDLIHSFKRPSELKRMNNFNP